MNQPNAELNREKNIGLSNCLKSEFFIDNHIRGLEYKVFKYIVQFLNIFENRVSEFSKILNRPIINTGDILISQKIETGVR